MDITEFIHLPIFKYAALAVAILGTIAWGGVHVLLARKEHGEKYLGHLHEISSTDFVFLILVLGLWKLYLAL